MQKQEKEKNKIPFPPKAETLPPKEEQKQNKGTFAQVETPIQQNNNNVEEKGVDECAHDFLDGVCVDCGGK